MIGTSFNSGWEYRRAGNVFMERAGLAEPWQPVVLPHDAMLAAGRDRADSEAAPRAFFRTGSYQYQKTFLAPEDWRTSTVVLRFEGVYRDAFVYVNGEQAAHRAYGYSEFSVTLSPFLRYGQENQIRVEARTGDDSRWYPGGGIYRDTTLYVGGPVHVALDGIRITTPDIDDERAIVVVTTEIVNRSVERNSVEVLTELVDPSGEVVASDRCSLRLAPTSTSSTRQRLAVGGPRRWDVEHPDLYRCRTVVLEGTTVRDREQTSFGIRSLQLDPTHGFRLNGRTVKLRGACIHHDNGLLGAATIARADERRVELLKEAGFNAIRSAHNPASRALLDACDRLGILVMDEAFDAWTQSKRPSDYSLNFTKWWEIDLETMVTKDFNHPSVVMYSIGNEIPELGTERGVAHARELAERVRDLDGTRFVTSGVSALLVVMDDFEALRAGGGTDESEPTPSSESSGDVGLNNALTIFKDVIPRLMRSELVTEMTMEAFAALDVAGYNYLESRYLMDAELFPNRVILGTETAIAFIATNWPLVETNGHLIGDFAWTGWDYLGEVGIGRTDRAADEIPGSGFQAGFPWLTAWCGDIDITGYRQPASYFREIVFGLRSDPFITVQPPGRGAVSYVSQWSWTDALPHWSWSGCENEQVTVDVYSDADEVELLVNGRPSGRVATGAANDFKGRTTVTYEPGEIVAVSYRAGRQTGQTSLKTPSEEIQLSVEVDRKEVVADDQDLAFVTITLVDESGIPHPNADRSVRIEVSGSGILQGFGSANPANEEGFQSDHHTTFRGRALAVIRPTSPGAITVTASANGCTPAILTFAAQAAEVDPL